MSSPHSSPASQRSDHLSVVSDTVERAAGTTHATSTEFFRDWQRLDARNAGKGDRLRLAFKYCHNMVYSVASRITGRPWDAEDVTQSTFEQLSKRLDKIRHPSAIPSFLKTTAVRMSLRRVKRDRWRRDRLKIAFASSGDEVEPPPEAAATIRQLLTQLEPEERAAVVLKHVEMHSGDEVAVLLGVSPATARRRLAAGRKKLAALIGEGQVTEMFGSGGEG